MTIYLRLSILTVAAALTACATTPGNMRQDPEARRTGEIDLPYQLALKRVVDQFAECTSAPMLPIGTLINDVQHYPDLRQASITRGAEGVGRQIHEVIDIAESSPGKTRLTVFSKVQADRKFANIKAWAEGRKACY